MPAVSQGKVLVTGASGFIAIWVVKALLDAGFEVRGTVRSTEKGEYLKKKFEDFGGAFEYVIVEDIEKPGAFDEAVKGVAGIEHTASPFHLNADDPKELIGPAVRGTVGLLLSAATYAPHVRRVVVTSSTAAVNPGVPPPPGETIKLNESLWNEGSPKEVHEKGKDASNLAKYRASKVLAEKAAWKFVEDFKDKISFDLVTINPPFVFGPIIHAVSSPKQLNTSVLNFYDVLKASPPKTAEQLSSPVGSWVDVRDVAAAHLKALKVEDAGGKRFVVGAGEYTWQDVLDALPKDHPGVPKDLGSPGSGKSAYFPFAIDSTRSREVLGLEYISLEKSAGDMLESLVERGW